MSKINIILTGFMGCGKTTVGRRLAKALNYAFIDTDQQIEERCNATVQKIFSTKGEESFREMESDLARELGKREGLVISTGGGMMLNPKNVAALCANGRVFCLVATPEEIFKRISGNKKAKRPLLDTPDPLKRIIELMQQRKQNYAQFLQIDTSGKSIHAITQHLIAIFQSPQDR
jgi:shikimate kinase